MVNSGYKQTLVFGNETKFGSTAVINQPIGLVQSVSPTESNNMIKIRTLGGTRDYNNVVPGKFEITGSFDYYLQGAAFLRYAIGEDTGTTTTVDSGPKIHTGASYLHIMGSAASPGVNTFPSFTLEFTDDEDGGNPGTYNLKRKYSGCRVNSATINATVDDALKVSVDWAAINVGVSTAAPASVTQATVDPFVFYQGAVYATSGAISAYTTIGTASKLAEVNGFDMSINNNLETVWYISGTTNAYQTLRGPKLLIPKGRDYEGSLDLHFANKNMYQKFLGAATATSPQATLSGYQIVLDFVRSGVIGATPKLATDNRLRIVWQGAKFNDINISGAPEDIVGQKIVVFIPAATIYAIDQDANFKS